MFERILIGDEFNQERFNQLCRAVGDLQGSEEQKYQKLQWAIAYNFLRSKHWTVEQISRVIGQMNGDVIPGLIIPRQDEAMFKEVIRLQSAVERFLMTLDFRMTGLTFNAEFLERAGTEMRLNYLQSKPVIAAADVLEYLRLSDADIQLQLRQVANHEQRRRQEVALKMEKVRRYIRTHALIKIGYLERDIIILLGDEENALTSAQKSGFSYLTGRLENLFFNRDGSVVDPGAREFFPEYIRTISKLLAKMRQSKYILGFDGELEFSLDDLNRLSNQGLAMQKAGMFVRNDLLRVLSKVNYHNDLSARNREDTMLLFAMFAGAACVYCLGIGPSMINLLGDMLYSNAMLSGAIISNIPPLVGLIEASSSIVNFIFSGCATYIVVNAGISICFGNEIAKMFEAFASKTISWSFGKGLECGVLLWNSGVYANDQLLQVAGTGLRISEALAVQDYGISLKSQVKHLLFGYPVESQVERELQSAMAIA